MKTIGQLEKEIEERAYKKLNLAIRTLKEISLGNEKQDVIKSIEDGNIVLSITIGIIKDETSKINKKSRIKIRGI